MSDARRRFLLGGGACLFLPGCVIVRTYHGSVSGGFVAIDRAEFLRLAEDRRAIRVTADGLPEPVLLVETAGSFRAFSSTCTHQQCEVRPSGGLLRCPCHGSAYDLEGEVVRGPAGKPLPTYPVRADEARIHLSVVPEIR